MRCPMCGSTAVVARPSGLDVPQRLEEGLDPLDLVAGPDVPAVCRACGHEITTGPDAGHR